jgi:hypothetical protein
MNGERVMQILKERGKRGSGRFHPSPGCLRHDDVNWHSRMDSFLLIDCHGRVDLFIVK